MNRLANLTYEGARWSGRATSSLATLPDLGIDPDCHRLQHQLPAPGLFDPGLGSANCGGGVIVFGELVGARDRSAATLSDENRRSWPAAAHTKSCTGSGFFLPAALVHDTMHLAMVPVAQWQSATLWMWMLRVRNPSGTPEPDGNSPVRFLIPDNYTPFMTF